MLLSGDCHDVVYFEGGGSRGAICNILVMFAKLGKKSEQNLFISHFPHSCKR